MTDLHHCLKKYFGYDTFRPLQQDVIETLMRNEDVLLLMPTGGGKSLCFQVPALLKEGTALVISPLIALMKDQVEALKANGIAAAFLNSSMTTAEANAVHEQCKAGKLKLLYMAPETLVRRKDTLLGDLLVSMIAVDEAHCISNWGHDFRPEYSQLSFLKEKFTGVPVIALTATADKVTRNDILRQMNLPDAKTFISSFDRPNLSLKVKASVPVSRKIDEIAGLVFDHRNASGIIYCLSRKSTELVAGKLQERGINCAYYHAGMETSERNRVQEAFRKDDIRVIVATIAFGMGIDKSNVRFVVHYNLPKNIESYYQEIGRAGRDGLPSETVLYYSVGDLIALRDFARNSGKPELNLSKLQQMQDLAEAKICRRKILLNYFSETMTKSCGNCDICSNPPRYIDGTIAAQKALSAIVRTGEKTGFNMVINILRGSHNQEILEHGFQNLKTYGIGREYSYEHWQALMMQMLQLGLIELAYDENYALKVTAFGQQVLKGTAPIHFAQPDIIERKPRKKRFAPAQSLEADDFPRSLEEMLFDDLLEMRKLIADSEGIAPSIVFNDSTIQAMARSRPQDRDGMLDIAGVSENKMEKYGQEFLGVIAKYPPLDKLVSIKESLSDESMNAYLSEMRKAGARISHHSLGLVLTGSDASSLSPEERLLSFYAKLKGRIKFTDIRERLKEYFDKHIYGDVKSGADAFFNEEAYNNLADETRARLESLITSLPLLRPEEKLTPVILDIRKTYPRSHEPWSENETDAFREATQFTNDLIYLSKLFGRSPLSMRGAYEQMLKRDLVAAMGD